MIGKSIVVAAVAGFALTSAVEAGTAAPAGAVPDLAEPIPSDDNHRHFGGGQTEAEINLASGRHTLQLLLGDHNHIPHTPPLMSHKITVTVK